MKIATPFGIRGPEEAHAVHLARVEEALEAAGPCAYGAALAAVLGAVVLPVASAWSSHRSSAVERVVRALADRRVLDAEARLTPRERNMLRLAESHTSRSVMASERGVAGRMGAPIDHAA